LFTEVFHVRRWHDKFRRI